MSDQTAFEREVDEEVRQDELLRLWKTYGPWLIGAIVAGIAVMAASQGYDAWKDSRLKSASDGFEAALKLNTGDDAQGADMAAAFAKMTDAPGGYAMLSRFRQAQALAETGKTDEALALYDELAGDTSIDRIYATLAGLRAAYLAADREAPAVLLARIEPQLTGDNPWAPFLRDLKALAHIRAGDLDKALEDYRELAADETTPQGVRNRAARMQDYLTGALASSGQAATNDTAGESGATTTGGDDQ